MGGLGDIIENIPAIRVWEVAQRGEASIVDVRGHQDFAYGHPQGALSLPYSSKGLVTRLGLLLERGTSIVLLTANEEQDHGAGAQLRDGPFPVIGVLEGKMEAWSDHHLPIEELTGLSVYELADLAATAKVTVLDVREPIEWELGHVPGALLISLGDLRSHLYEIPRTTRIAVICEAGIRSSSAASILRAEGFPDVVNIPDGTGGYRNAGLPLEFFEGG